MTNYICINGKKTELTEEQMKALGIELPKANLFERVADKKSYYFVDSTGEVCSTSDWKHYPDNFRYNTANYCTDKSIMEQRALHETLNRLLWRYSMTHKGNMVDDKMWSIKYDHDSREFVSGWVNHKILFLGEIAFDTEEIAENAINEIVLPFMEAHPEFKM